MICFAHPPLFKFSKHSCSIFSVEEFCATQRVLKSQISGYTGFRMGPPCSSTSAQRGWLGMIKKPSTPKSQELLTEQSCSLCIYTSWLEELAPVSAFKRISLCNQNLSSLRHHSTKFPWSGCDLQDINYWDQCHDLTSPKDILQSKADEVDFPRLEEQPPCSEQSVGSPLVQYFSFSSYTPFKYPIFKK